MPDLAEDMLCGAQAIADFRGETIRRTNYLLEQRQIPAFKVGGRWYARKSTLITDIEKREAAAQVE